MWSISMSSGGYPARFADHAATPSPLVPHYTVALTFRVVLQHDP